MDEVRLLAEQCLKCPVDHIGLLQEQLHVCLGDTCWLFGKVKVLRSLLEHLMSLCAEGFHLLTRGLFHATCLRTALSTIHLLILYHNQLLLYLLTCSY